MRAEGTHADRPLFPEHWRCRCTHGHRLERETANRKSAHSQPVPPVSQSQVSKIFNNLHKTNMTTGAQGMFTKKCKTHMPLTLS